MNIHEMFSLGLDRVLILARAGALEYRWLWSAVKGGWKYFAAIQSGDIANDIDAEKRARICAACSAFDEVATGREDLRAAYCGTGEPEEDGATCGCLVTIRVNGLPLRAAGKTVVASEECPRNKWRAVTP